MEVPEPRVLTATRGVPGTMLYMGMCNTTRKVSLSKAPSPFSLRSLLEAGRDHRFQNIEKLFSGVGKSGCFQMTQQVTGVPQAAICSKESLSHTMGLETYIGLTRPMPSDPKLDISQMWT